MKLAFSTLGCPEWSWVDITAMASDLGFDGIEIRGLGQEIQAARAKPFTDDELPNTMKKLSERKLSVTCFSSACCLKKASGRPEILAEGFEYIDLAARAGVPYVRILADLAPEVQGEVDDSLVARSLVALAEYARFRKITLLVETNGVYADTARLRNLLESLGKEYTGGDIPAVAVLWDLHHPWRFFGESAEETWGNIGQYLRYVHIKDSVRQDGKIRYKMLGEGDVPIDEMLELLMARGYDGYVCLEWVKRWSRDLEDAAVVFPAFIYYMRNLPGTKASAQKDISGEQASKPKDKSLFASGELVDITLGDLLARVAAKYPDQPAVRYITQDYRRSYAEFLQDVDLVARGLLAIGTGKGDHVAVWGTNHPQWLLAFFAAARIGAILVTVNTSYKIHEAEYLLRQSDTHTLIMMDGFKDADYVEIINEICPELANSKPGRLNCRRLPLLRNIINFTSSQPGCFSWQELLEKAVSVPPGRIEEIGRSLKSDEVINMQYTSGTTGFPKGVMLTHYNIINNGKSIGECMRFSPEDRLLIPVPFFHCFGLVLAILASVTHAATMVPLEYFQPGKVLEAINREKCTAMHGVPTMFIAVLEHPDFAKTDFSQMRTGIMAGSPCPVKVMQDVVNRMNMNEITIVFGQTESSPGCTQSRVDDPLEVRVGTVGRALPGVECRIVDPATNEPLPDGQAGEFVARGYNIMKGYYKMPEATAAAIDEAGWLHTGDLAVRDANGNYKITGRIKDMIIRGGENIYPKEIEDFLYTHPEIRDVQVVGVPDATYGEVVMAAVICREGSNLGVDDVKEYVRGRMAKHKTPAYVCFVDSFPMTGSGKIQKFKIREWAVETLNLKEEDSIETA